MIMKKANNQQYNDWVVAQRDGGEFAILPSGLSSIHSDELCQVLSLKLKQTTCSNVTKKRCTVKPAI